MDPTTHSENAPTAADHVDVLIVGAGLSGIGAACHLQTESPGTTFAILEARGASGGTWDQFRYPGVRSDSDMFTLGYKFRPWKGDKSIAEGRDILAYLRDTATAYGVDKHIAYHSRVVSANWSSDNAQWTVTVEDPETSRRSTRTCSFLYLCSGYYRYDEGYTPLFKGREDFGGTVVHPQHWPQDLDVAGRKIVVIGSGATAVTLVPALARTAAKVTMLQRSPSYVMPLPSDDKIANMLRKVLPERSAYRLIRWKNIKMATLLYSISRKYPDRMRSLLRKGAIKHLPEGFDVDTHFNPAYQPWDQRMCFVPDGDFFDSISSGKAIVMTDHVESFTPTGLRLRSGEEIDADIVVTATGLNLAPLGGLALSTDGRPVDVADHVAYKAMMLHDVPNLAFAMGYTNAPWTLKVDLVSSYVARIVGAMKDRGFATVTPRLPAEPLNTTPLIDMTSGYFERSRGALPLQGDRSPWRVQQHFGKDAPMYTGAIDDEALEFGHPMVFSW